jgi:hypothetical protein
MFLIIANVTPFRLAVAAAYCDSTHNPDSYGVFLLAVKIPEVHAVRTLDVMCSWATEARRRGSEGMSR